MAYNLLIKWLLVLAEITFLIELNWIELPLMAGICGNLGQRKLRKFQMLSQTISGAFMLISSIEIIQCMSEYWLPSPLLLRLITKPSSPWWCMLELK